MVSPLSYASPSLSSTLQNGVDAYQSASRGIQNSASQLAGNSSQQSNNTNPNTTTINGAVVNLLSNELQAKAATEVIKTADGMLGTIIDTFA